MSGGRSSTQTLIDAGRRIAQLQVSADDAQGLWAAAHSAAAAAVEMAERLDEFKRAVELLQRSQMRSAGDPNRQANIKRAAGLLAELVR